MRHCIVTPAEGRPPRACSAQAVQSKAPRTGVWPTLSVSCHAPLAYRSRGRQQQGYQQVLVGLGRHDRQASCLYQLFQGCSQVWRWIHSRPKKRYLAQLARSPTSFPLFFTSSALDGSASSVSRHGRLRPHGASAVRPFCVYGCLVGLYCVCRRNRILGHCASFISANASGVLCAIIDRRGK